tara:strand:+ start:488 stop:691 length:204 start_codon:yes stop_codon:yes gene_type:complete
MKRTSIIGWNHDMAQVLLIFFIQRTRRPSMLIDFHTLLQGPFQVLLLSHGSNMVALLIILLVMKHSI